MAQEVPSATTAEVPASVPVQAPDAGPDDGTSGVGQQLASRQWTGDFDGMVERRRVRILAPYSRTYYFIDKGVPHGIAHEVAVMLEKTLNEQLKDRSGEQGPGQRGPDFA
ncbi:MAG: hypothetical protein V9E93_08710 [Steroidobacteraceae bacterium]